MAKATWATLKLGDLITPGPAPKELGEPQIAGVNKRAHFHSFENHIQVPKVTLPGKCFINMSAFVCTF